MRKTVQWLSRLPTCDGGTSVVRASLAMNTGRRPFCPAPAQTVLRANGHCGHGLLRPTAARLQRKQNTSATKATRKKAGAKSTGKEDAKLSSKGRAKGSEDKKCVKNRCSSISQSKSKDRRALTRGSKKAKGKNGSVVAAPPLKVAPKAAAAATTGPDSAHNSRSRSGVVWEPMAFAVEPPIPEPFPYSAEDLAEAGGWMIPHIADSSAEVLHPAPLSRPFTINFWPPSRSAQRGERPLTNEEVARLLPEPLGVGDATSFVVRRSRLLREGETAGSTLTPHERRQEKAAKKDDQLLKSSISLPGRRPATANPPQAPASPPPPSSDGNADEVVGLASDDGAFSIEPVRELPLFSFYMTSQPRLELITKDSSVELLRRVYKAAAKAAEKSVANERRAAAKENRPERPVSFAVPDVRDAVPHATYAVTTLAVLHPEAMSHFPIMAGTDSAQALAATGEFATNFTSNDVSPFSPEENVDASNADEVLVVGARDGGDDDE